MWKREEARGEDEEERGRENMNYKDAHSVNKYLEVVPVIPCVGSAASWLGDCALHCPGKGGSDGDMTSIYFLRELDKALG